MTRKLVFRALLVVMTGLSLHDLVVMAQGAMTPPGTFIPSAWWKKMLDDDKINGHVTYIEARFPGNVTAPPAR
jgi:hypothetical protein